MHDESENPGPFLKWAGGKRSLLGEILPAIPKFTGKYLEPFLGAGAVFFRIGGSVQKIVSDTNNDLIITYETVRDEPERLLTELKKHRNEKDYYLQVRSMDRSEEFQSMDKVARASRFIFLNKTCFNGLYRVNSKNQFNVPFGNYKNPDIVSEIQIRKASAYLSYKATGAEPEFTSKFQAGSYEKITRLASAEDFIYLDPPYDPVSPTSNFVSYGKHGFAAEDQEKLRDEVLRLHEIGAKVMLSNSNSDLIKNLYSSDIFHTKTISTRRAISARSEGRSIVKEVLITNYRRVD